MSNVLEDIYKVLKDVIPNKVFYGNNIADNGDNATKPYIVYQEISNRIVEYADDKMLVRLATIQINLITSKKDISLEQKLESTLEKEKINYQMISELSNEDSSFNRIYEIKKEVFQI